MSRRISDESRDQRGTIADSSVGTWRTQRWILLTFLVISLLSLITWGEGFTIIAPVAAVLAWAGQWAATIAIVGLARTRAGRIFRNSYVVGFTYAFVIIIMAVATVILLGADARINGWIVLLRIVTTLWISSFLARWAALDEILQQERATQETLRELRADNLQAIRTQRVEVMDRVAEMMRKTLDDSSQDSHRAADGFARFAREVIRPLSHQIADDDSFLRRSTPPTGSDRSWRQVAESVTSRPALRPWLMATAVFASLFIATATPLQEAPIDTEEMSGVNLLLDTGQFAFALAFHVGIFFVTALSALVLQRVLTRALPRLGLRGRVLYLIAAPILIAVIVEICVQVAYVWPGLAEQLSDNLWLRLVPAILIMSIALLVAINRTIAEVLNTSAQRAQDLTHELSWELSRLECTYTREQRFFASQLHGPLQSMLTSASLRIASIQPGTPQWDAALDGVRGDFETTMERLITGPETPIDLGQLLDELRQTWSGVCEVDIRIDDDVVSTLNADWISAGIVNDVLIEACANAAIHGSARNIRLEAQWCGDEELQITATNDGSTDLGGSPGLGTTTLDRVAMNWSRDVVDEGVRLRVVLAIPRAAQGAQRSGSAATTTP